MNLNLELSLAQQFTLTKYQKELENCQDVEQLKELLIESIRLTMIKNNALVSLMKGE